jgi:tight adherence protein C
VVQQRLAQAGIRKKEWAVAVIFGRMIGPIVLGGLAPVDLRAQFLPRMVARSSASWASPPWSSSATRPRHLDRQPHPKRTDAIRKGLPDALDLLVICAEAGLTVDAAFGRVARELGRAYPELGDEFALTAIELSFLTERRQAFENLAYRVNLDRCAACTTMIQTERYGAAGLGPARALGRIPQRAHDARRGKGRACPRS